MVIACPAGSALAERAKAAGIPVFTGVRLQKANRLISFFRDVVALGRLGRAEAFDWLHTHGSQDTWATVCARWFFRLRAPILSTRHNTKPVRFHFFNRWLYRRGIERVVVVSGGAWNSTAVSLTKAFSMRGASRSFTRAWISKGLPSRRLRRESAQSWGSETTRRRRTGRQ